MLKVFVIISLFIIAFAVGALLLAIGLGFCAWACGCEKSLPAAIKRAFKRLGW